MQKKPADGRQRIVSLAPSVTSILVALGARSELVGVTQWCKDVADVGRLPRLGDCWSLDATQVETLRPTLVIGSVPYRVEMVEKLLALPAPFLATNPRSLADVFADIRLLGRIVGRERAAERVAAELRGRLDDVARRARRAQSRPRVYCEAWPHPRISSPPWVAELVAIAGGKMVLPAGKRISDEAVARAKPEVIVLAWAATGERAKAGPTLAHRAWRNVPAIRNRQVYVVRDEILNTPGPPLVEGAKALLRILHPELAERKHGS